MLMRGVMSYACQVQYDTHMHMHMHMHIGASNKENEKPAGKTKKSGDTPVKALNETQGTTQHTAARV